MGHTKTKVDWTIGFRDSVCEYFYLACNGRHFSNVTWTIKSYYYCQIMISEKMCLQSMAER